MSIDVAVRSIPTRRISFAESLQTVPRHFAADGDLIQSHFAAVLSSLFPDGEDFFVRSVRRFRDEITDPALKRRVAGFIGQESMHGREHRKLNDRLAELGYPTKRVERITAGVFRLRERLLPGRSNLAATAALEHYTATLAELLLGDEEARASFGHREVLNLFLWHALEESEHKAVAFDVYKAVGGSERMRTWTMNWVTFMFIASTIVFMIGSLLGDRETYRPGTLRRSWRAWWQTPIMRPEVWRRVRDYNRPDFHPDDHDNAELVARWRAELFGGGGALNDKLESPIA